MYINDLQDVFLVTKCKFYADDTVIYASDNDSSWMCTARSQ